jgi:hypothetical protein
MLRFAIIAICVFLQACEYGKEDSSTDKKSVPSYEKVTWVMLRDVQGLWGGRNLYLARDGTAYAQIVTPPRSPYREGGLDEQRFQLNLAKEEVDSFINLLNKHDFLGITIRSRPGVPDEGRPSLLVRFSSGEQKTVEKWANDKHADFDAIYSWLLSLTKNMAGMKPILDGRYDEKWSPENFEVPK